MTHFERLGLPDRFDLDPAALEAAFLAASRAVHPDHHAGGQADTAAVNAAYHALRDPVRRAEYLLGLQARAPVGAEPQDPAFLLEMMDLRERVEAHDPAVAAELAGRLADATAELGRRFAAADWAGARRAVGAVKTLRSLQREAD